MRKLAYVTGLVAFAAIATGGERVAQQGGKIKWSTSILTLDDKIEKVDFSRRNIYYFDDVDSKDVKDGKLPYDADSVIDQLTPFQAKEKGKTVLKYRKKTIDCRIVAKKMVGAIMTHDVFDVSSKNSLDGETRRYIYRRGDRKTYSALIARNLHKVSIRKGDKPGFRCERTEVPATNGSGWDKEYAACGNLSITYKPQRSLHDNFVGKKVIVFDKKACGEYADEMSPEACETLVQAEGCGLRYVQLGLNLKREKARQARDYYCNPKNAKHFGEYNKIKAERICDAPKVGLHDFLMEKVIEEKLQRENGQYAGIKLEQGTPYVEDDDSSIECEGDCEIFGAPTGLRAE